MSINILNEIQKKIIQEENDMGFIIKNLKTNKEIYITTKSAIKYIDEYILKRIR